MVGRSLDLSHNADKIQVLSMASHNYQAQLKYQLDHNRKNP